MSSQTDRSSLSNNDEMSALEQLEQKLKNTPLVEIVTTEDDLSSSVSPSITPLVVNEECSIPELSHPKEDSTDWRVSFTVGANLSAPHQSALNKEKKKISFRKKLPFVSRMVHTTDFFPLVESKKNEKLFFQSWIPVVEQLRGIILLVHGLHEHSGRYSKLAQNLIQLRCAIFAVDLYGHGQSSGKSGFVERFERWNEQVSSFYEQIILQKNKTCTLSDAMEQHLNKMKNLPVFLFGQGIGGAVCVNIHMKYPDIRGSILSAPLLQIPKDRSALLQKLAGAISAVTPHLEVADLKIETRCHSITEIEAFKNDKLCRTGKMRARVGYELLEESKKLNSMLDKIEFPFLVLHGTLDNSCDVQGSKDLMEKAKSKDKKIILYQGFFHDLLHEVCCDSIIEDASMWIDERL